MRARGRWRDEQGLTLIELMVSFFLLSVILSAVAASLITFTQATADNERRVEATALLNRLHEELQATSWFDSVLYDGELDELTDPDDGIVDLLEGRDLVTIEGPSIAGCDAGDEGCNRRPRVPRPYLRFDRNGLPVADGDDAFFEAFQAVTWSDASEQTKRFTTVVRWQVLDREFEETFESDRVATAGEAGDPTLPRVVQFQVGPSPMSLTGPDDDPAQRHTGDLTVVVRFSEPVDSAAVRFYQVHDTPADASEDVKLEQITRSLTAALFDDVTGKPYEFRTTLPAGTYRFPDGSRNFEAIGTLGGETFTGTTSASFFGGGLPPTADPGSDDVVEQPPEDEGEGDEDLGDPPAEPVSITDVTVTPLQVCMDTEFRFEQDVTISARVEGMTVDDNDVAVAYETQAGGGVSEGMRARFPDSIEPTGAMFDLVLEQGKDHGFRPQGNGANAREQLTFKITATRRSDDGADGPVVSETFTATRHQCK